MQRPPVKDKTISVHRAFVYGASAPGWGEIYAGSRTRGFLTASLFVFFLAWFIWTLVNIVGRILGLYMDRLMGASQFALPDVPYHHLVISFFGIYYLWLWAMISSVDVATDHRRKKGEPPQKSVAWSLAVSWFCPGAGQTYTGARKFGYIIFAVYLLGILLVLPAYKQFFDSLSLMVKSGKVSTNNPYALISIIREHLLRLNYGFGNLLQLTVKYFAIAGTIWAMMQVSPASDTRWIKPSLAYGAALFGIGWLCPGSGQLLQGRDKTGWFFLVIYVSSMLLIGLLMGAGLITAKSANTLAWGSVIVQWFSMVEAPFRMIIKILTASRPR